MTLHVGIIDVPPPGEQATLKQAALAFDRLVVAGAGGLSSLYEHTGGEIPQEAAELVATYNYLVEAGVVLPLAGGAVDSSFEGGNESDVIAAALTEEKLRPLLMRMYQFYKNASSEIWRAAVRDATDRSLRRAATYYQERFGWNAVAVLPDTRAATRVLTGKRDAVVDVLIEHLPIPSDDTPWEAILDFRQDPDVRRKYLLMRDWLNDLARGDLTPIELHDRLRAMLSDYEHHMQRAKMKVTHGAVRTVLTVAAEVLEGVLRFKPTQLVDALFFINKRQLDLSEAEQSAPGREIAYILDARERLG